MASRDLNDLKPATKERALNFLALAEEAGLDVLIYCTYRSLEEQARLFRKGRSLSDIQKKADELNVKWDRPDIAALLMEVGPQYGKEVTKAAPGQSIHNYRQALDGCPVLGGKPVWSDEEPKDLALWNEYGRLGVAAGFEWAGNWKYFKEKPHIQEPGINWRDLIYEVA